MSQLAIEMSGIYGLVRFDGVPVTREALAPIATAMSFWGPDGHGQWCGESAGLGHLMLHTTPESLHERLPASILVAPHLVITADARIDNRDELFNALGVPRHGREQTPDSSLILLAYERWGAECVKRLLGDFAFAIWDAKARKLFCARDYIGCRPFVYYHDGRRFVFGSDIKGVLTQIDSPKLNEPLLATYLQMRSFNAEMKLTFFEGAVKLLPAHTLTVSSGGVQLARYWSPHDVAELRLANGADYADAMRALFEDTVRCRLRSAFPIATHLSGGLDSSSIAMVAGGALDVRARGLAAFSWSPEPELDACLNPDSEHLRINAVCRSLDLKCQYVPTTVADLIASFQLDFTVEPTFMMAREANVQRLAQAQGKRVMLSGWGGDDAVSAHSTGYLSDFLAQGHWSEFQHAVNLRLRQTSGIRKKGRALLSILQELAMPHLPDNIYAAVTRNNPFMKYRSTCIQPAFARRYQSEFEELRGPAWRFLPGFRATICRHLEIGHIAIRAEHWAASGASHNLVYRYPMLDRRLVDFILGAPVTQLNGPTARRCLFRRAVNNLLPPTTDWRPVKREPNALTEMTKANFQAHVEWAGHLLLRRDVSWVSQYISRDKIAAVVQSAPVGRMENLDGVRQALGCYAINHKL
jgi:asparagine synthase (glutamine-hydrolysing)